MTGAHHLGVLPLPCVAARVVDVAVVQLVRVVLGLGGAVRHVHHKPQGVHEETQAQACDRWRREGRREYVSVCVCV